MPSGYVTDQSIQKFQMVKCYDQYGNFIDTIKDAPYLTGFKEQVSSAISSINVELPRPFDNFDGANQYMSRQTIAQGNVLKWFLYGPRLPTSGLLRYQGVIEEVAPSINESGGESVKVKVTPFSSVIADHGIVNTLNFGTAGNSSTYVDPLSIMTYFFTTIDSSTGTFFTDPLTLDPSNPTSSGNSVQYMFQNQTIKSIWDTTQLLLPSNWYYRNNANNTVSINVESSTPQHIFNLGQHFTSISYSSDNTQRKNVIVVTGNGSIVATARGASAKSPKQGGIGQRIYYHNENRITDQNTAQAFANGILAFLDRPLVRTTCRVFDYRGDMRSGLGYDIEALRVGDTVKIKDTTAKGPNLETLYDVAKYDVDKYDYSAGPIFDTVNPIVSLSYAWNYVDLEIGSLQPSQSRALYSLETRFQDFTMGT